MRLVADHEVEERGIGRQIGNVAHELPALRQLVVQLVEMLDIRLGRAQAAVSANPREPQSVAFPLKISQRLPDLREASDFGCDIELLPKLAAPFAGQHFWANDKQPTRVTTRT